MTPFEKSLRELSNKTDKFINQSEKEILNNYKATLDELKKTISKVYERYEEDGKITLEMMNKYNRIQKLDEDIEKKIKALYNTNTSLTRASVRRLYTDNYQSTKSALTSGIDKQIRGIMKQTDVTKVINERMAGLEWTKRLQRNRNELIYRLSETVGDGFKKGSTYREMAKRLTERMEGDVINPTRIVRTEGKRVAEQGKMDMLGHADKQGVKMVKRWVTSRDERVRQDHIEMDGITVPYEDDFELPDGSSGPAPGHTGEAQQDINCRCTFVIDIE